MHLIVTPQARQRTSAAIIVVTVFCAGHPQQPHASPAKASRNCAERAVPALSSLHFELNGSYILRTGEDGLPTIHFGCWCQVAVTFLIKTNGQVTIPVFYKVKQRFPSPTELADPRNAQGLLSMIRHLNRLKQIQKYTESGTTMHVKILLSLETRLV
ncbi:hypothetical protein E4U52_000916 [Claviceps spartinae]|nr:hypothetical protein E4U52_000916 [Claviceps spartinae]